MMIENTNLCSLSFVFFPILHHQLFKGYHSTSEIISFHLICKTNSLMNNQDIRENTTRCTILQDHRIYVKGVCQDYDVFDKITITPMDVVQMFG